MRGIESLPPLSSFWCFEHVIGRREGGGGGKGEEGQPRPQLVYRERKGRGKTKYSFSAPPEKKKGYQEGYKTEW